MRSCRPFAARSIARCSNTAVPGAYGPGHRRCGYVLWAWNYRLFRSGRSASEDAAHITQPVLAVLGADSEAATGWPAFGEGHRLLLEWFPQAKPFVLPRAAHLLQVENPHDMAEGLAAFLATA